MAQGQVSIRTLASHHSIVRMPRAGLTFLAWHLVGHLYTFLSISLFRERSSIQIPWSWYTQKGTIAHLQVELLLSYWVVPGTWPTQMFTVAQFGQIVG